MEIKTFEIPGIILVGPKTFTDDRGQLFESYRADRYEAAGIPYTFCQDIWSCSKKNVLRGLHYQINHPQGRLVTLTKGRIFDVGLDLRRHSPTFGTWLGLELTADPPMQFFLPPGVAHGYCVLSDGAEIWYKFTEYYAPNDEAGVLWSDPDLAIAWPSADPILSARDGSFPKLSSIPEHRFPK